MIGTSSIRGTVRSWNVGVDDPDRRGIGGAPGEGHLEDGGTAAAADQPHVKVPLLPKEECSRAYATGTTSSAWQTV